MSASLTIGIVALVLSIFGTGYFICVGRKPLKDYISDVYIYMKWHKCFGNKRIKWLEKYVDKTSIAMSPSISEAVVTWNLICEVILTTNLNSISVEEADILLRLLLMASTS